jgi:diaminopimelate epimerase
MKLQFTKMHGLGNDFVVLDAMNQRVQLDADQIRFLADRHFGVGCDQLLLVEPSPDTAADFRYRIFNADGREVEQCGNGARCFARFVRDQGLTDKDRITVETRAGLIELRLETDGQVTVDMGRPRFDPADIPFQAERAAAEYRLEASGEVVELGAVSLGNPHAVIEVADVTRAPVDTLGPAIERHKRFPNRVNVGFMEVVDPAHIRLRVYERGVGETLACGSGACAAVAVGRARNRLGDRVHVELPGGHLVVSWRGEGYPVMMTGPATRVFEGRIEL